MQSDGKITVVIATLCPISSTSVSFIPVHRPSLVQKPKQKMTCIHFLVTEVKCCCIESDTSATFLPFRAICSSVFSNSVSAVGVFSLPHLHCCNRAQGTRLWPVWASTTKIVFSYNLLAKPQFAAGKVTAAFRHRSLFSAWTRYVSDACTAVFICLDQKLTVSLQRN